MVYHGGCDARKNRQRYKKSLEYSSKEKSDEAAEEEEEDVNKNGK